MPRISAAAAEFAYPGSPGFSGQLRPKLKPPDDLSPEARAVFVDVVVNSNPEHFQPADLPLLCVYVEAIVQARSCAKLLSEGTGSDFTLRAQRNALTAVYQLSMRLRVSPQARQVRKSLGSNTRPPSVNYYDRVAMEMGSDEEA
jgi:hypothetical protein